jgi:UDP-glucose 4-epimerase
MKEQILVTGGTGYIGSHTVIELFEAGYEPVIIDNLSNSEESVLDGIQKITGIRPEFHCFDLCDREKTENFFLENKDIAGIIHFAAYKAVGESVEKPLRYYHNNLLSLIHILEGAAMTGVRALVFSSSCTVYGQPDVLPVTEDAPVKPATSPYGNTKQICEEIIRDFASQQESLQSVLLRYFNPVGAHPSAEIGELPIGVPNNLVPFITQTAAGVREQLKVFGNDYNTPDGTAIRDYIDVVDLAKAHVVAVDRMLSRKNNEQIEVFNLGTGRGLSVLEVINAFEKVNHVKVNYSIAPRRAGDTEKVWADTSKANQELGWKAEKSLEDTLKSAWEWEKKVRGR